MLWWWDHPTGSHRWYCVVHIRQFCVRTIFFTVDVAGSHAVKRCVCAADTTLSQSLAGCVDLVRKFFVNVRAAHMALAHYCSASDFVAIAAHAARTAFSGT